MSSVHIDPPEGWKYGFPKSVSREELEAKGFNAWLVENGYPMRLIQELGDLFFCRIWYED